MISEKARKIKPSATLALNTKIKQMIKSGKDIINLTIGEPDFDTPEHIKRAAIDAIRDGFTKYTPAEGIEELRKAIAKKLKKDGMEYSAREIIISNGSKHSISNALQALLNEGDEVIIPVPYWVSYSENVSLLGGVPVFAGTQNFLLDAAKIKEKLSNKTKVVIVNSPNNPTGAVYGEEELKKLAKLAIENDFFIVSDEIYEKLIYDKKHHSTATFAKDKTILINGVSKTYAMTGWRIGYAAGPEEIIKSMANIQSQTTGSPNSISQKAALEALTGQQGSIEKMIAEFRKRRDFIVKRLNEIGLNIIKPEGAFYVFPEINGKSMGVANQLLKKAKVAVVPGAEFGSDKHIRISYATSMENIEEGMNRIEKFFSKS